MRPPKCDDSFLGVFFFSKHPFLLWYPGLFCKIPRFEAKGIIMVIEVQYFSKMGVSTAGTTFPRIIEVQKFYSKIAKCNHV